jgi:hypothetical protein
MDRRRNRRWPRQLEVRFWRHGDEGSATRAISTNISRTGIFIRTQMVLPSGTRIRVDVGHSGRSVIFEGMVMRALKSAAHLQAVMPSGMGVRFMTPEELLGELLPGVDLRAEERIPSGVSTPTGSSVGTGESAATMGYDNPGPGTSAPSAAPPPAPAPPPPRGPQISSGAVFPLRFRDQEQFRRAFERDVQTGGLFISTDQPAPLDAVIAVEVSLEGSGKPAVRLQARVVHRLEPPPGAPPGNLLAGMGVQFLDVARAVSELRSLLH